MYYDLLRSNEVKCWSKPSNQGQIGQISRNIPNIHMFRLRISSRIQIQDYLRSNQVIKRSNLGQNRQIRVKSGQVVEIYPICVLRLRILSITRTCHHLLFLGLKIVVLVYQCCTSYSFNSYCFDMEPF